MEFFNSLFDTKLDKACAITVGKFDGIHKGHSLLTSNIKAMKSNGLSSCIVTFVNSPRLALKKDELPSLITNFERERMLESLGIDFLIECPFDDRMMKTSGEDFIKLLCENLNMKYLTVGSDFKFGYKGLGDVQLLNTLSEKFNFELDVVEKLQKDNRDISSTFIREELLNGNITNVNDMLGYDYFVWGEIVHGNHLGHRMGIPTINILPPKEKLIPLFGVYATTVEINGRLYHGVTNVGMKPTVSNTKQVTIETNIMDFDGDLYGEVLKVTFKQFIRPETKFNSIDELVKQMNLDKKKAIDFFNK